MVEGQEAWSQYFYGFRRDRSKIVRRGGVCWSVGGTTITNHRGRSWNRGARNMETGRPVQMTRDNVFPPSVFCQARLRPGTFRLAEKLWRSILVRTASKGTLFLRIPAGSRTIDDTTVYRFVASCIESAIENPTCNPLQLFFIVFRFRYVQEILSTWSWCGDVRVSWGAMLLISSM